MFSPLPPRLHETASTNSRRTTEEALQTWCQITLSFTNTCVSACLCAYVCVCLCVCWCNNLCSLPHYTVLHRGKWVLSMFLHLNYATDVIGSGVAEEEEEEEEECRGSSYTPLRDQRALATLGDLFSLSRMPPSLFTNQRCFQNQCVRVC